VEDAPAAQVSRPRGRDTRWPSGRPSSVLAAEQPADQAPDEPDGAEGEGHQPQFERHAEEDLFDE